MNKRTVAVIFITISLLLAVFLMFFGIRFLVSGKDAGKSSHQITEDAVTADDEDQENKKKEKIKREVYIQDKEDTELLKKYMDYNEDVVGLIRIEGTVLNHPVMQTVNDEEFYLYKDLDKNYNSHGIPFLSADSLMEGREGNRVIYGHNIYKKSKDVFADLAEYRDAAFYKEHPVIETVSKSGTRRWLIFAYFIVDNSDADPFKYSDVTEFPTKTSFEEYFKEVEIRNWLDVPVDISVEDTYLTLSSCSRELAGSGTNRMVVIAKQLYADEEYAAIVEGAVNTPSPLLPEKLR